MSNDESIGKVVDELCLEIRRGFDKPRITKDKENDWLYVSLKAGIEPIALIARSEALKEAANIVGRTICKNYPACGSMVCDIQHVKQQEILALLTTTPQKP